MLRKYFYILVEIIKYMREIDLSKLPDELSEFAIDILDEKIKQSDANGVKILPKTKLILFNSEKDRNLILFGEIKQKLRNNFKEKIKNDKEYSDNNVDKYINMIEFRKIGE